MMRREATVEGEFHLHQFHWLHGQELLRLRDEGVGEPRALGCTAFIAFTFALEAFANRLLECGYPKLYRDERSCFNKGKYRGTLGKLMYLATKLGIDADSGIRPFQSLKALFTWRDAMAHARVERITRTQKYTDPRQVVPPESELMSYPASPEGRRALEDAEQFCDSIQAAAHSAKWKGILVPKAFSGFMGLRGISL